MSHLKERKEKICLNCGAAIYGRYCHACGQENVETKESFWHLLTHFVYDITHFDGKFFSSLKYLLFKPAFLSNEYLKGKRHSYLNPIKMYVFTSAIFFIAFFSMYHPENIINGGEAYSNPSTAKEIKEYLLFSKENYEKRLTAGLSASKQERYKQRLQAINADLDSLAKDSTHLTERLHYFNEQGKTVLDLGNYKTVKEYDSTQRSLPPAERDGWFKKNMTRKLTLLNEKYKDEAPAKLIETCVHKLPQLLFISLPIFAALLYLLYIKRKKYFYVEHGIFSIHLYIAVFILMMLTLSADKFLPDRWTTWTTPFLFLLIFVYLYKAIKNFYKQGHLKTILKFLLLNLSMFFVIMLLFVFFFFFSIFII